ncbi:MAG: pyruvate dehydrogenase (acetyl-transferring), homodimeric type, partial [Planctomycetota bacterium]
MSDSKTVAQVEVAQNLGELQKSADVDVDAAETKEWLSSLDYVLQSRGPERVKFLIEQLRMRAAAEGVPLSADTSTPYVNTIAVKDQPAYPGNRELERRIKSIIRWNAMAMVVRANKRGGGVGGHISTFASSATLYEVAFNHFFRGRGEDGYSGDSIYFQGHASPGMYSRAFVEGRLSEAQLENFRRELEPEGGLSSYPHPWLMPSFWEYPTVSMGLGPIMAIYQARFNEYMRDRGMKDTSGQKVWAFLGDGECDEPETLGAIGLAAREKLDNLIFVINCNLQRLDGPVRGNGKIIQELESIFNGAGWNVIKVIWGGEWDELLAKDTTGLLAKRMNEVVDGQYQKYTGMPGSYIREHFFGKYPELLDLVKHLSDEKLEKIRRGGHDPEKVYAAYKHAMELNNGKPTVILAKTVKGYGLGEAGEGRNVAHNQKKMNEEELLEFRTRFGIPISDEEVGDAPFYKPPTSSHEMRYLKERRVELGGSVPSRPTSHPTMEVPSLDEFGKLIKKLEDKSMSTTFACVQTLIAMCRDKKIGKNVVPIVPDESRTFGMEGMFRQFGIYAHAGQLYEPVDS